MQVEASRENKAEQGLFTLSMISYIIISFIFVAITVGAGIASLVKINYIAERGKGMVIAGIVLSCTLGP